MKCLRDLQAAAKAVPTAPPAGVVPARATGKGTPGSIPGDLGTSKLRKVWEGPNCMTRSRTPGDRRGSREGKAQQNQFSLRSCPAQEEWNSTFG